MGHFQAKIRRGSEYNLSRLRCGYDRGLPTLHTVRMYVHTYRR